jgi:tetratricopeptide (TPR) repeat protein
MIEFYARNMLGAIGVDLAALTWFFDEPFKTPAATLETSDRGFVLGEAAYCLSHQGRLVEALTALQAAVQMAEHAREWYNAASRTANLGQCQLLGGDVIASIETTEKCLAHAKRASVTYAGYLDFEGSVIAFRSYHAGSLYHAGRREEAECRFADIERYQRKVDSRFPLLHGTNGYFYWDLLLTKGDCQGAHRRATKSNEIFRKISRLLELGLAALTLGRIQLSNTIKGIDSQRSRRTWRWRWPSSSTGREGIQAARALLDESVDRLRTSGRADHLPRGLLGRAAFHRSIGDWAGAARDLDEVLEIAEPGPMRLFLCDMALERARLALARGLRSAPLNGLIESGPPKPEQPSEAERKSLHEQAEKQLAIAADYIETCGYHLRNDEVAELKAVLRGERTFASLPPRV